MATTVQGSHPFNAINSPTAWFCALERGRHNGNPDLMKRAIAELARLGVVVNYTEPMDVIPYDSLEVLALRLNLPQKYLRALAESHAIPFIEVSGRWRFNPLAVQRVLDERAAQGCGPGGGKEVVGNG